MFAKVEYLYISRINGCTVIDDGGAFVGTVGINGFRSFEKGLALLPKGVVVVA